MHYVPVLEEMIHSPSADICVVQGFTDNASCESESSEPRRDDGRGEILSVKTENGVRGNVKMRLFNRALIKGKQEKK